MIEDKIFFESTKNTKLSGIDEYSEKTIVKNQKSPNLVQNFGNPLQNIKNYN